MVLNYRYMVLELFYDGEGPVLTHSLLTTAIKDSILHTFGEFGLGSSQSTLHGYLSLSLTEIYSCESIVSEEKNNS